MTDDRQFFLSALPAGPGERRLASAFVLVSLGVFLAAAPFAALQLAPMPAFIPIVETALVISDLITAVLVFGQFSILRSRALLVLASGYVFTAFITVAHVLTFPGVFSPTGLFGASRQSAVWLYVLWHGGFPLFVMAYALLKDEQRELIASSRLPHTRAGVAIASSVAAVFLLVCGLTLLATANLNSFPAALQKIVSAPRGDGSGAQILIPLFAADWILGLVAIIVLWRRRPHTLLDLWLIVVMCAWLFDIALSGLLARARFDLGWYGGRIYALVAANAVLVVLLIETGKLYTQLVRAHAGERQERRLVHERTVELMVVNKQLDASMTALRESEANLAQRVREKTAELSESEARYRSYFESSLDAQFLAAPDGSILDVNSAACQMLGRPAEEIKRLGRKAVVDMTDPRLHAALVERARAGGMRAEITMIRADGTTFPAEVASSAFIDAAGLPKTTVSMRDITERKQAESRIRTQLEHLSLLDQITRSIGERLDLASIFQIVLGRLEDSLPVDFACMCLHDPAANALWVTGVGVKSAVLADELALQEQATVAVDANGLSRCVQGQLVYEPDIGALRFPFPQRLAGGGLGSAVLAPLRSESRVFGVLVVARRQAQGFSSAECEFLRQLSEHVALAAHQAQLYGSLQQAYDELRQTQAAAMQEERLRALGQMASGIAHDINNALSPVSLYVESMLEGERNLSERARGYLQTIQRAVDDVAQTVARLREFYRQREAQLVLAPVQLNDLVQQVLDLTRARWSDMPLQRGVVVRAVTDLAPGLPAIMGAESEIREALTNLVFNAVDAMPEGGTLVLRTRLLDANGQPPAATVEVSDTGCGMDEDTRKRCLEPFFTTKGERGTGLGLAMVFGMAQRHGADLQIDSAPGAGTTIRLLFAVPPAVQAGPGQPAGAPEVPARLRLLLIDDDPVLLKSLRDTLESDGHVIVTASGGDAGIGAFRAALGTGEAFAAVITDLGMPYVDGRRVAMAVKEASPATPVILLTGWGRRMVAEGDIPPHVDRVLAKPPRLREVRQALAELCHVAAGVVPTT